MSTLHPAQGSLISHQARGHLRSIYGSSSSIPSPISRSTCGPADPMGLPGLPSSVKLPPGCPGCSLTLLGPSLSEPSYHTGNSQATWRGALTMMFWSTVPPGQPSRHPSPEVVCTPHSEVVLHTAMLVRAGHPTHRNREVSRRGSTGDKN